MKDDNNGELWKRLSDEQKQELLLAYDESFDNKNLLNHEQVSEQHKGWLKPSS